MVNFDPIQKALDLQGFLVLDGALASELETRGATLNHALWSAKLLEDAPDMIRQVHYDYLVHGADMLTTASYQATFEGFAAVGWDTKKAIALFRRSVNLAKEARALFWRTADKEQRIWPLIAASIGPYGAMLADGSEYRGAYGLDVRSLMDFHRPRVELLIENEVDLLAFETIPSIEEAEAIVRLMQNYKDAWAWLSFSCKSDTCISDGTSLKEAVQLVKGAAQIAAVGINCTPPGLISALLGTIEDVGNKNIIVYPNSGEDWDATHKCWIKGSNPLSWEQLAKEWYQKGARIIGGCCRSRPKDIRVIRKTLRTIGYN